MSGPEGTQLTLKIQRQIKYTLQVGRVGKNNIKTIIIIKKWKEQEVAELGFDI